MVQDHTAHGGGWNWTQARVASKVTNLHMHPADTALTQPLRSWVVGTENIPIYTLCFQGHFLVCLCSLFSSWYLHLFQLTYLAWTDFDFWNALASLLILSSFLQTCGCVFTTVFWVLSGIHLVFFSVCCMPVSGSHSAQDLCLHPLCHKASLMTGIQAGATVQTEIRNQKLAYRVQRRIPWRGKDGLVCPKKMEVNLNRHVHQI